MMPGTYSLALPIAVTLVTMILLTGIVLGALFARRLSGRLAALEELLEDSLDATDELSETLGRDVAHLRAGGQEQLRRTERLGRQVEQIAVDIVRRDAYRLESPAAQRPNAIAAARDGHGVEALVREHGLSADEAELLVMLHGESAASGAGEAVR